MSPARGTTRWRYGDLQSVLIFDNVLPSAPYRQWVITFPKWLRIHLATDHALQDRVLTIALREIHRWQRARARALGHRSTRTASVTFLQRFGSALQLNPHAHIVIPDGVFGPRFVNSPGDPPAFIRLRPPTDDEVATILLRIARKVLALAERLGLRERPLSDESLALARTIALPIPQPPPAERWQTARRSAFFQGFSLHANSFCHENDRASLERLCRYALRPPFALDRMSRDSDGRIRYRMKRALPDGSTDLVLSPVEYLRRLASLVAPPRKHLTRYGGLFAPAARDRNTLRPPPSSRPPVRRRACPARATSERAPSPPSVSSPPAPPVGTAQLETHLTNPATPPKSGRPTRTSWRDLLQRVYAFDVFQCPDCGGRRRIVAAISDPDIARRILTHIGLDSSLPSPRPARPPPGAQLTFAACDPAPTDDCDPPSLFE